MLRCWRCCYRGVLTPANQTRTSQGGTQHSMHFGVTPAVSVAFALPSTPYTWVPAVKSASIRQLDGVRVSTGSAVHLCGGMLHRRVDSDHHQQSCNHPGVCRM
jgi:hypothetical protein